MFFFPHIRTGDKFEWLRSVKKKKKKIDHWESGGKQETDGSGAKLGKKK